MKLFLRRLLWGVLMIFEGTGLAIFGLFIAIQSLVTDTAQYTYLFEITPFPQPKEKLDEEIEETLIPIPAPSEVLASLRADYEQIYGETPGESTNIVVIFGDNIPVTISEHAGGYQVKGNYDFSGHGKSVQAAIYHFKLQYVDRFDMGSCLID